MTLDALIAAAFIQGLVGSGHCMAMCGPLTTIWSAPADSNAGSSSVKGRLKTNFFAAGFYNTGRLFSYALFGFILGSFSDLVDRTLMAEISLYAGVVLLAALGITFLAGNHLSGAGRLFAMVSAPLRRIQSRRTAAALSGLASGLLPCGLLYPAYALAIMSGNGLYGALVMSAFAFGTMPAMFGFISVSQLVLQKVSAARFRTITGLFLIFLAAGTVVMRARHGMHGMHGTGHQHKAMTNDQAGTEN